MPLKTDGAKIRELRESQAMTLTEFAAAAGYALNSVHMIEVGKANGGPKFIRAAAKILGCEIADITDGLTQDRRPDEAQSA
jgi:transcriptional regulator with XRE-family HTH domain